MSQSLTSQNKQTQFSKQEEEVDGGAKGKKPEEENCQNIIKSLLYLN